MKNIAFLYEKESLRSQRLFEVLGSEFNLLPVHNEEEAKKLLKTKFNDLAVFIIDTPAEKPYAKRLISSIVKKNTFMFALPIIALSDVEHAIDDDCFYDDGVVAMIRYGDSKRTILQRIKNTIKFANATSFDDFSDMLKALPSLIYLKDTHGRYAFCSQSWHHLYDPNQSIRGLTDMEIRKDKKNARLAQEKDRRVVKSGKGMSYLIKEEDEEGTDYLQIIKEPVKDAKGKVTGIIAIINNVTQEELLRQELRRKSITDELTGLYNRNYFEEIAVSYKGNLSVPLTVIIADCDGLKRINDRYGHAAGDEYIRWAKDAMKAVLPAEAKLFRMGGDEFLAVLPHTKRAKGQAYVNAIVEETKNYHNDQFALRLSAGSYTATNKGQSIEAAVSLADKAMYRMKDRQNAKSRTAKKTEKK